MGLMDEKNVPVECEECGTKFNVSVADGAAEKTVKCPKGHAFKLKDGGGGFRKAKKSFDDLERQIKKFGK